MLTIIHSCYILVCHSFVQILKRDRKSYIINISKDYSIVSQFTSFVAIEEREKDEKFDSSHGPSIMQLVEKEGVDKLSYMGWTIDQGRDPEKVHVCRELQGLLIQQPLLCTWASFLASIIHKGISTL